jgi:hypothetical protein
MVNLLDDCVSSSTHTSHCKSREISAHISKVSFVQESRPAQRQAGLLKQLGRAHEARLKQLGRAHEARQAGLLKQLGRPPPQTNLHLAMRFFSVRVAEHCSRASACAH